MWPIQLLVNSFLQEPLLLATAIHSDPSSVALISCFPPRSSSCISNLPGTMSKLPPNLISFGPDANCTLDICPLEASLLQYRPSVPVNSLFIAIFGFTTVAHLVQGFRTCSWGFMASIVCGNLLEIVGYVGRVLLHDNPFSFSGFVMQIGISNMKPQNDAPRCWHLPVCITVAPVFYCSAIYVLLSNV